MDLFMLFLVRSQQVLWRRYRGLNNSPLVITPINLYASYGLNNMQNHSKGTFPSDTQKNPKDCMAIQLRSGKDLSNNRRKERKEETEVE